MTEDLMMSSPFSPNSDANTYRVGSHSFTAIPSPERDLVRLDDVWYGADHPIDKSPSFFLAKTNIAEMVSRGDLYVTPHGYVASIPVAKEFAKFLEVSLDQIERHERIWPVPKKAMLNMANELWFTTTLIQESGAFGEGQDSSNITTPAGVAGYCLHALGMLSLNAGVIRGVGTIAEVTKDTVVVEKVIIFGIEAEVKRVTLPSTMVGEAGLEVGSSISFLFNWGKKINTPEYLYWTVDGLVDVFAKLAVHYPELTIPARRVRIIRDAFSSYYVPRPSMLETFSATVFDIQGDILLLRNVCLSSGEQITDEYILVTSDPDEKVIGKEVEFQDHVDRVAGIFDMPEIDRKEYELGDSSENCVIEWV